MGPINTLIAWPLNGFFFFLFFLAKRLIWLMSLVGSSCHCASTRGPVRKFSLDSWFPGDFSTNGGAPCG